MPLKLPPLRRERASDVVYEILRDHIMSRGLAPGERLNVRELARRMDVSPTPVKDAVNRLATEGLVEIRPRSGTFVTPVSAGEVRETFEVRAALETLAAEKAVSRRTPEAVGRFRAILVDLEKPARTDRERALHEQKNEEFHAFLVTLAGNRRLIGLYRGVNAHIKVARIHAIRQGWRRQMDRARREHREIFRAFESGNRARLARALRSHILRGAEDLAGSLMR